MRICHVTPHLPPDQAANALLPFHLGTWATAEGDEVRYVAHRPRQQQSRARHPPMTLPGPVAWVPTHHDAEGMSRLLRLSAVTTALAIVRAARPSIRWADVVHVHSNGLIAETAALLAERLGKPVVLTLYGTEIWHYAPRRWRPDFFTRAYRRAAHVTFYSHGLLTRATELGLGRRDASVVYPPVAPEFTFHDERAQAEAAGRAGVPVPPPSRQRKAAPPACRAAVSDRGARRGGTDAPGYQAGHLRHRRAARGVEERGARSGRGGPRHLRRAARERHHRAVRRGRRRVRAAVAARGMPHRGARSARGRYYPSFRPTTPAGSSCGSCSDST